MAFRRLTSDLRLCHKVSRNRITFGAHTANMSKAGLPGKQHGAYLPERAIGGAVIVCDEGGNMRGVGTAWYLAMQGKAVTLAAPDPMVGKELMRTSDSIPIRAELAQPGVQMLTEHAIRRWQGQGATLRNLLNATERKIPAPTLIMPTTNRSFDPVLAEIGDIDVTQIGDAQAP